MNRPSREINSASLPIDVTSAVATLLHPTRQADPTAPGGDPRSDFEIKASLAADNLTIQFTFPRGSAHCCSQWNCHLWLHNGQRWYRLRQQLADLGVDAPARLQLHVKCVIEEGALFRRGLPPDPAAFVAAGPFQYSSDVIEAPDDDRLKTWPPRLSELRALLLDEFSQDSRVVITDIRQRGLASEAVDLLRRALCDEDPRIREHACSALSDMNGVAAALDIRPLLGDRDAMVSVRAAYALLDFGEEAATIVPRLTEILREPSPAPPSVTDRDDSIQEHLRLCGPRWCAASLLGRLGNTAMPAREALRAALQDTSAMVRAEAAKTLAGLGEPAEVYMPPLRQALDDSIAHSSSERAAAARTLVELGEPADYLLDVLLQLAEEENNGGLTAIELLGTLGPIATPAIPLLRARLSSRRRSIGQAAAAALRKIEGRS